MTHLPHLFSVYTTFTPTLARQPMVITLGPPDRIMCPACGLEVTGAARVGVPCPECTCPLVSLTAAILTRAQRYDGARWYFLVMENELLA